MSDQQTETHTAAPWHIESHVAKPISIISRGWSILDADGNYIGYVLGEQNEELKANARLIAAAPELLAAIKELSEQIRAHHPLNVRKDYSLMLADAAAMKVVLKVEGKP
jgi:hypothetical protein